jgi:parallel beta-helix repeat protein
MNKAVLAVFTLMLLLCIICLSGLSFPVKAIGTIVIRADGSVEPDTAPIFTIDNVTYTFTGNIYDEIVVERDNIVVDGKGYTVQGTGSGTGIYLSGRSNVTVKNMEVRAFERGIRLNDSSNNTISANNVTNNEYGIVLYYSSSKNTLRHNDASDNRYNLGIFTASASGYIQDIDDSNTVNGKPVYYWVNRRDMAVPVDAGYVVLVNCTRITVKNLSLTNNMQGVALAFTTNSTITNNNLINNFDGIRLDHSSNNNLISGNNITANTHYGIRFYYDPSANAMSKNNVVNNEYGSQLDGTPCNNTIYRNNITDNGSAIRLDYPSNNTISANNVANNSEEGIGLYGSSSNNTVCGNNIVNNSYGIWFYASYANWIYHNNFIDNTPQVYPSFIGNFWDAGYPSGGNYWSPQYDGTDIYSGLYQNETGSDGIRDAPYSQDNYPLMGMFSDFNVTSECHVQTICNSTISGFKFNGTAMSFLVTDKNGTAGFCRICIPTALMNNTFTVLVNSTVVDYYILSCSNDTHNYLYFIYAHSTQEVIIIPEFPSYVILPLFMIATLLIVIVYRRKRIR